MDKFYQALEDAKRGVTATNGDYGYFVTLGELIDHGGKDEFFRKTKGGKVGGLVYYGLEYDRSDRAYYADCYNNVGHHSGALHRSTIVFIGFDF